MKKHFKNSCKNLVFLIVSCIYLLIIMPIYFCFNLELHVVVILIFALLSPFFLYFMIGFYWVFQMISISKDGITFYLFNKIIDKLKWDDIEEISVKNFRIRTYLIKKKNENRYYNIDSTKSIDTLMSMYATKEVFRK